MANSGKIKLIALDLDGTLLYQHREVRPRNIQAIAAARAAGVEVTLVTGRMYRSAREVAQMLGLRLPLACYQGALVRSLKGETLLDTPIQLSLAQRVIRFAEQQGLIPQAYVDDRCCVSYFNHYTADYALASNIPLVTLEDLAGRLPGASQKILCAGTPEACRRAWQAGQKLFGEQLYITQSRDIFLEFMDKRANKGQALSVIAAKFGFQKQEIMAVGDNLNDRELFTAAGLKIAMGDGAPELQAQADYVTASCAEDGVAQAIEKYILA